MSDSLVHVEYNLPSGYDDNKIVLLSRDPHTLFAYWEISNSIKERFDREFGHELWEHSIPVLKVTNVSANNVCIIRTSDYANSWYINVDDSGCLYTAELGRRVSEQFFISLASSNYISTPAGSISVDSSAYFANYRDLRNGISGFDEKRIYDTYNPDIQSQVVSGPSSPELFRRSIEESFSGISSSELFGIGLHELLGISSESLINPK